MKKVSAALIFLLAITAMAQASEVTSGKIAAGAKVYTPPQATPSGLPARIIPSCDVRVSMRRTDAAAGMDTLISLGAGETIPISLTMENKKASQRFRVVKEVKGLTAAPETIEENIDLAPNAVGEVKYKVKGQTLAAECQNRARLFVVRVYATANPRKACGEGRMAFLCPEGNKPTPSETQAGLLAPARQDTLSQVKR